MDRLQPQPNVQKGKSDQAQTQQETGEEKLTLFARTKSFYLLPLEEA
jgi:hypothetical protein